VSLDTPLRPPVRLPVTVAPVQQNRAPDVRISNPKGSSFTTRRRAERFVALGFAVWSGNAIRFITEDRGTPSKVRAEFRAARIATCAATEVRRCELERAARETSAAGSHTQAEWSAILSICGGRCPRCGTQSVKLTKDHVIPLAQGGSHSASNLQPLCGPCNSSKGARIIDFRLRVPG